MEDQVESSVSSIRDRPRLSAAEVGTGKGITSLIRRMNYNFRLARHSPAIGGRRGGTSKFPEMHSWRATEVSRPPTPEATLPMHRETYAAHRLSVLSFRPVWLYTLRDKFYWLGSRRLR